MSHESCYTYEFICATGLWNMCDNMSHVCMRHVSFRKEPRYTYEAVLSHAQMHHMTRTNESCHAYERGMSYM